MHKGRSRLIGSPDCTSVFIPPRLHSVSCALPPCVYPAARSGLARSLCSPIPASLGHIGKLLFGRARRQSSTRSAGSRIRDVA